MTKKQQELKELLEKMFQLDQSDLDFGIYRIMNAKAKEIEAFLQNDLIASIKEAFADSAGVQLRHELEKAIEGAKAAGFDPEESPKVKELKAQLESLNPSEALENDIYSHLATFFSRYYKDGDFISLRRYKKDTYAIPYEGEEVKLYWANFDQYYIKTSEYFKDYTFKAKDTGLFGGEEKTVHFKLVEAEVEANNNKTASDKERRFVLHEEKPLEVIDGELYIYFEYKSVGKVQQKTLNEKAIEAIFAQKGFDDYLALLKTSAPTGKNKDRTLLEKHLSSYTARNTFDYFIHKDLGGFLHRELDFYIKNEMLHIDDIEEADATKLEDVMGKVRTFKTVAKKIIAFLTQLEEFQKKLWLKKKFVITTDYCITLDRIPEDFYGEILNNEAQLAEWKRLYNVEVDTMETLKEEKYLVLDTKFFGREFTDRLLETFDDLDEAIDGVLIKSENFGALNLLQARYEKQIKAIYIDPPYNTNASEILYKNGYKNSTWNTLIENRISLSHSLLSDTGNHCFTIDDYELENSLFILNTIFNKDNHLATTPIRNNPQGRSTVSGFAVNHEYAIFHRATDKVKTVGRLSRSESQNARYREISQDGRRYLWENFRKTGTDSSRRDRPKQFYPIYVDNNKKLRIPKMEWNEDKNSWDILEKPNSNETSVFPIDSTGYEKVWKWGVERTKVSLEELKVEFTNNSIEIYRKNYLNNHGKLPGTWWDDAKYAAGSHGTNLLTKLFGPERNFLFPKSVYAVIDALKVIGNNDDIINLDYFAGSGTTGHAVIKLNREDGGKRKYILVEMGEYFDTVTKPRIQKVIYTDNWKDGKPQDKEGISHMFKYICLESYEDTLNNLSFNRTETQDKVLTSNDRLKEDYLLHYMLDFETKGSLLDIDKFASPYGYTLDVATGSVGETRTVAVDLVETFNYLLGLRIKTRRTIRGFLVIEGENLKGEKILVIWRDGQSNDELNAFFEKMDWSVFDREFDTIYVNGDNNLANLKKEDEHFKVKLIEEEFKRLMFDA